MVGEGHAGRAVAEHRGVMSRIVAFQRGGRILIVEKLDQCEECLEWFTVTIPIDLVPGKPPLRLCVRDFLISSMPLVKNTDAATGDGGNPAPVDGSPAQGFVCEPGPVAASSRRASRKPRKKTSS